MNKVMIDSDVLLDSFYDRKPHSEYANKILSLCESKRIQGFVTPVIMANVYYLLCKTASHQKVISKFETTTNFYRCIINE